MGCVQWSVGNWKWCVEKCSGKVSSSVLIFSREQSHGNHQSWWPVTRPKFKPGISRKRSNDSNNSVMAWQTARLAECLVEITGNSVNQHAVEDHVLYQSIGSWRSSIERHSFYWITYPNKVCGVILSSTLIFTLQVQKLPASHVTRRSNIMVTGSSK